MLPGQRRNPVRGWVERWQSGGPRRRLESFCWKMACKWVPAPPGARAASSFAWHSCGRGWGRGSQEGTQHPLILPQAPAPESAADGTIRLPGELSGRHSEMGSRSWPPLLGSVTCDGCSPLLYSVCPSVKWAVGRVPQWRLQSPHCYTSLLSLKPHYRFSNSPTGL